MQARPGYEHPVLTGNCVIKANGGNPRIGNAVPVAGCSPRREDVVAALSGAVMRVWSDRGINTTERKGIPPSAIKRHEGFSVRLFSREKSDEIGLLHGEGIIQLVQLLEFLPVMLNELPGLFCRDVCEFFLEVLYIGSEAPIEFQ